MRFTVIYSQQKDAKGLPKNIEIVATQWWFKKMGILKATLTGGNTYTVYVQSSVQGKGVARELLLKIDTIFRNLSKTTGIIIRHIVNFLDEEAEVKLIKYYHKMGYTKKEGLLFKEFRP